MFLWNSVVFSVIQQMLALCCLVTLPFLNRAWTSGGSWFVYYWILAWRTLSITLLVCEMSECNCAVVCTFFGIAFLWDWNENWPFPLYWVGQNVPFSLSLRWYRKIHMNILANPNFLRLSLPSSQVSSISKISCIKMAYHLYHVGGNTC